MATMLRYDDAGLCVGYRSPCLPATATSLSVELTLLCRDIAPFKHGKLPLLGAGMRASPAVRRRRAPAMAQPSPYLHPQPVRGGDPGPMAVNLTSTVAAALLALSAPNCNSPTATPSPTVSAALPPTTAEPGDTSPIDGGWVSHLTKQPIAAHIKTAGLGRWTRTFLAGQAIQDRYTAVYTFGDGRLSVAYFERGGIWHVGWKGDLEVRGHVVEMYDEYTQTTDVYRWTKRHNGLHFTRVKATTDADVVSGIPPGSTTWPTSVTPGCRPGAPWNRGSIADGRDILPSRLNGHRC